MVIKKSGICRLLNTLSIILLCLLMLAGFSVYLLPHFGWRIDGLRSGSMAPQLKTGDLVATHLLEPQAVAVGDIITFHLDGRDDRLVSHRVIGIQGNSPLSFQTKGDANDTPDPFITPARDLVGRVSFHFPLLGYAIIPLKTVSGLLVALVVPGLIIIWVCLSSIRHELVKKKRDISSEEQKRV
ncbi:MAG: hypothetical protein HW402_1280 [Dehalococcoidales bacterium]|nr:hypothetical protein [Dehalococcoidales bacterium]